MDTSDLPVVDFFFKTERNPEPDEPANLFFIEMWEWRLAPADETWPVPTLVPGNLIESYTTDDPGREIAGAREAQERQNMTPEEREADDLREMEREYAQEGWLR